MHPDTIPFLICPHCGNGMTPADGALRCRLGHTFDIARHGYVNMLPGDARSDAGDTAAMVAAREAFLGNGYFAPIADAIANETERCARASVDGCIVDLGAGTGYYLAKTLDRLRERVGLGLDISKYALRRAAKAHPRLGAIVCDTWRGLPVRDGAAALMLNVFAPRNGAEMKRILHPEGALIVVSPTERHLNELVAALGLLSVDERKQQRVVDALGAYFTLDRNGICEYTMPLNREDVESLIAMGPSARHVNAEDLRDRIAAMAEPIPVTASVNVAVYRTAVYRT